MHTRKRALENFIVMKEKDKISKEQSQVAETFNEYFTNITKDLIAQTHCFQRPGTCQQNSYGESVTDELFWIAAD